MKKIIAILWLVMMVSPAFSKSDYQLEKAKSVAEKYYKSLKQIADNPSNGEQATLLSLELGNLFGNSQGDYIPNDFCLIQGNTSFRNTPNNFFKTHSRMFQNHAVQSFDYDIKECHIHDSRKAPGIDDLPEYADVVIQKQYKLKDKNVIVVDTMLVNMSNSRIESIANKAWTSDQQLLQFGAGGMMDVEKMLANASQLYDQRKYQLAGDMYSRILDSYPGHEVATVKLGLMYIDKKYGKNLKRKQRFAKAAEILQTSSKGKKVLAWYTSLWSSLKDSR